jgi:hypothetical protein
MKGFLVTDVAGPRINLGEVKSHFPPLIPEISKKYQALGKPGRDAAKDLDRI